MDDLNKKVAVYIDGSNLYHKLKEIKIENTLEFDYRGFADSLARGREVISYRYYVGVVRARFGDEKVNQMRAKQQKLFSNLEKRGFCIKRGYLMENGGKFHEKGVDVKIATDMLIGAYENIYDVAIVVSSDTDLIPAIKYARYLKKDVEYIGFSHKPSLGLQKNVTISRLLIKDDLDQFIAKTLL
ncbi:MAG: NYN domain-containing protein [Patescibacteria group bacterium]|nr:NYN domain-containing protein [Patescibacteria group bacterium]